MGQGNIKLNKLKLSQLETNITKELKIREIIYSYQKLSPLSGV